MCVDRLAAQVGTRCARMLPVQCANASAACGLAALQGSSVIDEHVLPMVKHPGQQQHGTALGSVGTIVSECHVSYNL